MNRIDLLFQTQEKNILSLYFCAGYPKADNTLSVIRAMQKNGIHMVEVGIPFSDPMADGPAIQQATSQALRNGMNLHLLFNQLKDLRQSVQIPVILMGYLNPIFHYGLEQFCHDCRECGVDGVIIPDLPFKDYMETIQPIAEAYGLKVIMLITPETSETRIREIDNHTSGFIYMVSSASTTGAQNAYSAETIKYFERIKNMNLHNPLLVGFGISNYATLHAANQSASGAIIGSKFVSLLAEKNTPEEAIRELKDKLMK